MIHHSWTRGWRAGRARAGGGGRLSADIPDVTDTCPRCRPALPPCAQAPFLALNSKFHFVTQWANFREHLQDFPVRVILVASVSRGLRLQSYPSSTCLALKLEQNNNVVMVKHDTNFNLYTRTIKNNPIPDAKFLLIVESLSHKSVWRLLL